MPPAPGLRGNTLRQVVYPTLGGETVRLLLSNEYGEAPLELREVNIAKALDASEVVTNTSRPLLFDGRRSLSIPGGETRFSDPLRFPLERLKRFAITLEIATAPVAITGHPGSRTTSYLSAGQVADQTVLPGAATTDHWYFIAGLDVESTEGAAVVTLGDSLTDGRGSTTNRNDRWPDMLAQRLARNPATMSVSVLNLGIGGNAVLHGGLGPTALERLERDVLRQRAVRWLVILEGVNDLGTSSDPNVAERLIAAYRDIIGRARAEGIRVYGIPILPFGGSNYDTPERRSARHQVNAWIRSGHHFDAVHEVEAALVDPNDPERLREGTHDGDHLHLSADGYAALASSIDLALFDPTR